MKKETKAFLILIFIELVILLAIALFSGKCFYPNPCSVPTFFNPLGVHDQCIQVLTLPTLCNLRWIYFIEWLITITFVVYLIYFIKSKY